MKIRTMIAGVAMALLAGGAAVPLAHAAQVEKVALWDKDGAMGVDVSQMELKAGKVTFDVTNEKTSASEHEMVVIQLTPEQIAHPDTLPYSDKEGKVDEEAISDRGEVSELEPGQSGSLTLDLKPGTYMLLCNVTGHYRMKMYSVIHVS